MLYSNFVSLFVLSKRVMMVKPFVKMANAGITSLLWVKGQSPLHADSKDSHVRIFGPAEGAQKIHTS